VVARTIGPSAAAVSALGGTSACRSEARIGFGEKTSSYLGVAAGSASNSAALWKAAAGVATSVSASAAAAESVVRSAMV